jgi:AcrR family transcriptional regulator
MTESRADTRERLLGAAEHLFAREGYSAVSVRDIATAASVNLAAVNYHFQSKANLYRQVLVRVAGAKRERYLAGLRRIREENPGDLEAAVSGFYRMQFEDTLKTEAGGHFVRLLVREMHHGREETAQLVADLVIPFWREVGEAILEGQPGIDPKVASWIVGSLHGQLIHFTMRWLKAHPAPGERNDALGETMSAVFPPLAEDVDDYIDQAVAHITRFSVAGIRAILAGPSHPRPEADAP